MIKLEKIYIENFKLIDKAEISFSNDLLVLDGPNGFGKTTIFDAIELILIGKIFRIAENQVDGGNEGCSDVLYAKNSNKDVIIKAMFQSEQKSFTIVKRLYIGKITGRMQKRSNNWDAFQTYIVDNFDSQYTIKDKRTQKDINNLFAHDLERYYNLFYYIQQEEKIFYLKKKGKDRVEALSTLFDTEKEVKQKEKILQVKTFLDNLINKLERSINEKKEELDRLKKRVGADIEVTKVFYSPLLKDLKCNKEWDREKITISTKEQKEKYIEELNNIKMFLNNKQDFFNSEENKMCDKWASNETLLHDIVFGYNFLDKFSEIEEKYKIQKTLLSQKEYLQKDQILDNVDQISINELGKIMNLKEKETNDIRTKLEQIKLNQSTSNKISSLINNLNATRNSLMEKYNYLACEGYIEDNMCPFCGYMWLNQKELLEEIENKTKDFECFYDDSTKEIENLLDNLYENYLNRMILWIENYLRKPINTVDDQFFSLLNKIIAKKDYMYKIGEFCKKHKIDLNDFTNKEMNIKIENISENVNRLASVIRNKKIAVDHDSIKDYFARVFKEYFDSLEENTCKISVEDVMKKISYIDYLFFNSNQQKADILVKEIEKLSIKWEKLNEIRNNAKKIYEIYKTNIGNHWNRVIKQIEIPFYIYSGKLIQHYSNGLGIFIKGNRDSDSDELRSIKFVSTSETDHDAITSMSSGQLSALIISFTLALNKVYGQKLCCFLIDDPIQTMDDINMASFVELLRNEFANKQIIVSTHEDDVSMYMLYKFNKYHLQTSRYNVKDKIKVVNN